MPGPVGLPATAVITLRALPALLMARFLEARKSRKRTAYRDAFQRNLYHTWKQMSRQTLVIRRGRGSPAVTQGAKPNGGRDLRPV